VSAIGTATTVSVSLHRVGHRLVAYFCSHVKAEAARITAFRSGTRRVPCQPFEVPLPRRHPITWIKDGDVTCIRCARPVPRLGGPFGGLRKKRSSLSEATRRYFVSTITAADPPLCGTFSILGSWTRSSSLGICRRNTPCDDLYPAVIERGKGGTGVVSRALPTEAEGPVAARVP
jgi:hypothetical protein